MLFRDTLMFPKNRFLSTDSLVISVQGRAPVPLPQMPFYVSEPERSLWQQQNTYDTQLSSSNSIHPCAPTTRRGVW